MWCQICQEWLTEEESLMTPRGNGPYCKECLAEAVEEENQP